MRILLLPLLPALVASFYTSAKVSSRHSSISGFFDNFNEQLKRAFENDEEYIQKDNPGKTAPKKEVLYKGNANSRRVYESNLLNSEWSLLVAMQGLPQGDPSNDLYAPKSKAGKVDGIEVTINITILENGTLFVKDNDLTTFGEPGKWKLDDLGTTIAFSFYTEGLERVIKTKGSLVSVYGGEETMRTSSMYFVPAGVCMMQASVVSNESGRVICYFSYHFNNN